ncbi:MAG: helix-turn-helix domain-containing protein [Nostoc sp. NMS1]|uniref:helix-turn-helix transcriptional regulator n=1 Tax=unclassified Nostoc TaxID=2593658 RepID=UPI0025EBC1DE|nr:MULTISPECIES: helix-turn-helix domain-containing protein [unclassified Nostoc]MBN3907406.1 helix-turn-helix domain-containing protein [Nostoc sp. NMS1]MBN3990164.1 helix-turn-helix domain-containing protein [Nostoc sp. NMS2]
MVSSNEPFMQAENHWDLETLYSDLSSVKNKRLTPVEKRHLRGLLCGFSPAEIAEKLGKNGKGVETDLCATVYRYVKSLLDKSDEKLENWRNISEWLDDAGYKNQSIKVPGLDLSPEKTIVNVTNINIENNQLVIDIKVCIPTSENPDYLEDELNWREI